MDLATAKLPQIDVSIPLDASRIWLPGIVLHIASFLPPNEIPCTLRLVDKATALQFSASRTVRLSLSSPLHAFKEHWGVASAYRGLSRKQRLKLLELTAASGCVPNTELALASAGLFITQSLIEAAAATGQLDVCKLLRRRGCPWDSSLAKAARGGHRHTVEKMLASGCPFRQDAVYEAAYGGHELLMYWLLKCFADGRTADAVDAGCLLTAAAEGFRLVALQRLQAQLLAGRSGGAAPVLNRERQGQVLSAAAGSSTPDWQAKVEWLEGQGYPRMRDACELVAAARPDGDALGRLQWMCGRGYKPGPGAASASVVTGNLDTLRFLMQLRADVRPAAFACATAAGNGHLAVLQHLHSSGFPLAARGVAGSAAGEGRLPVVAWAVQALGLTSSNTPDLFDGAAKGASIGLLTWLRDRGWSWGREAVPNAAEGGCEEQLEWLVHQGCPLPVDGRPYRFAARFGDLATVRCLHRLGCPWGPNQLADCIFYNAPVPVLRGLLDLGCPVDWVTAVAAAEGCDSVETRTAALEWLAEERHRQAPEGTRQEGASALLLGPSALLRGPSSGRLG